MAWKEGLTLWIERLIFEPDDLLKLEIGDFARAQLTRRDDRRRK